MISDERYLKIQVALREACGAAEGTPFTIHSPSFPKYSDDGRIVQEGRSPYLRVGCSLALLAKSVADKVRKRLDIRYDDESVLDTITFRVRDDKYASYLEACDRLQAFVSEIRAEVEYVHQTYERNLAGAPE